MGRAPATSSCITEVSAFSALRHSSSPVGGSSPASAGSGNGMPPRYARSACSWTWEDREEEEQGGEAMGPRDCMHGAIGSIPPCTSLRFARRLWLPCRAGRWDHEHSQSAREACGPPGSRTSVRWAARLQARSSQPPPVLLSLSGCRGRTAVGAKGHITTGCNGCIGCNCDITSPSQHLTLWW